MSVSDIPGPVTTSASGPSTVPEVETPPAEEQDVRQRVVILPPWLVILHNDEHNDMLHVVQSLLKSVPKLGRRKAVEIMMEAHNHGRAVVTTCPLELAELYRDRLQSFGLTATIEKAG